MALVLQALAEISISGRLYSFLNLIRVSAISKISIITSLHSSPRMMVAMLYSYVLDKNSGYN